MRTQSRLQRISTALSLLGLALGFSALGLLIVAKEHDGGASIAGGILGILLGAAFLIAACLHWKCGDQIQGGFRVGSSSSRNRLSNATSWGMQSVVSENPE
jgi:peptidoglycan/LPS O-acetylase OafA/YrhL